MGDDENSQMGFQHSDEVMLNSQSSGLNTSSLALSSVYGTGWDPRVSLGQSENFGTSSMVTHGELIKSSSHPMFIENQGISSSHLVTYPSNSNFDQLLPRLPILANRNFPDIAGGPFGLAESSHSPISRFPHTGASNRNGLDTTPLFNNVTQAERCGPIVDSRAVGVSPDGKRKRGPDSMSLANEHTDDDSQKEHPSEASPQKEQDDKKKKNEQSTAGDSSGKQAGKQVKENSQCEEAPKQNYIHVRARRGQATNSHSLAERVRREKISERMRLLQELVPGCNKITGKAVMLDEIINYVQSLQQQVEFLSMKLSTVSSELNFDIERLLPKDILHSRGVVPPPVLAFQQGMGSSHTFSPGIHQSLNAVPNPASQFHHMPQATWDNDLQSLLHMGFDSNAAVSGLGPNGNSKTDM